MAGPFRVRLSHCRKYKGESLSDEPGWNKYKGECAAGVQYVFAKAKKPLGRTRTWREGAKVKGNKDIRPGTAIASFRNGTYQNDHAAIFVKETREGLVVWDQWKGKKGGWSKRTLYFGSKRNPPSNDGDYFSTIVK